MKAKIEIELGNSAFGNNDAERLFEMRNVIERLMDNADRIMAADVGDFTTAQDTYGNTVARMDIVEWVTIGTGLLTTSKKKKNTATSAQR